MIATVSPVLSEAEYLKLEEASPVRHEFINGKMYEMSGGTMYHEKVIMNLVRIFLRSTTLEIFSQGLRVRLPETKNYFYPDVVLTEEKVAKKVFIETPLLVVEVLSPATRLNDLTDKFIAYRQFSSLKYYLVAEADFCRVTLFFKDENNSWEMEEYSHMADIISLTGLSVSLPLVEVYKGMSWSEKKEE